MKKIKLGDVCKFIDYRGKTPQKTANGIPLITAQIIKDGFIQEPQEFISPEIYNAHMRRGIPKKGDVVLTTEAPLGEVAQIRTDERLAFAQRVIILQADEKILHNAYLLYDLKYKPFKDRILGKASGTTVFGIRASELKEVELEVPSLETQKKIAAVLSVLDDKIALNQKMNATLEAMAKTLYMHEFFHKPPNGKLNDIIIENSKSIIPVGAAKSTGGKFPFFTSGDSVLSWTDSLVDGRNIFLNDGGNAGVKFYVGKAAYSTHTYNISAKENLADYIYLLLKVIEPELDKRFFTGTGLKNLRKDLLKEREIYIPTKTEREKFNAIVQPCFTKISANFRESRRLAEMRDWLLPMLMNGQIQFKEI